MNPYFGEPIDAPAWRDSPRVPTPTDKACLRCHEPIIEGDRGWLTVRLADVGAEGEIAAEHAECRMLGIVGHHKGVCSCTGFEQDRAAGRELWRRMYGETL